MEIDFRLLNADEIDCRVAQCKDNGLALLLYKDARVDMNILDETVGCMNWMKAYSRDNANCTVSIWDAEKQQWISKEDTGTESNTEAEKGLASDSFKRACFNWGIGRELYTAPFIWVKAGDCNIQNRKCYDRFSVAAIGYDEKRRINELSIRNDNTRKICFEMHPRGKAQPKQEKPATPPPLPDVMPSKVPSASTADMRGRIATILHELTGGKVEDMRTGIHHWTNGVCTQIAEIPGDMLPEVLDKAESLYRKRKGADFGG